MILRILRIDHQIAHAAEHEVENLAIRLGLAGRVDRLVSPLHHRPGVGDRAVLLHEERRREQEHLRLDLLRVCPGTVPERRRFGFPQFLHDERVELVESFEHDSQVG
jgi:hypothetical protein